jgi:predicted  nucleic acid-binding Zn-ribbon protein
MADLSMQLNNLSRRLRILEERYTSLRKKTQDTDQNILGLNKEVARESKLMHSELVDFRREFYDLRDKAKLIVKELKECAKTDEVKVLENYINLWEPVNFVTRREVERIVEQKVEELLSQAPPLRHP